MHHSAQGSTEAEPRLSSLSPTLPLSLPHLFIFSFIVSLILFSGGGSFSEFWFFGFLQLYAF